jgi:y4mF family transcriptional regulator
MIGSFIQEVRKSQNITQERLSEISGVGLRFIRDLEQGKATVRLDKVNQVLAVFGYRVGAVPLEGDSIHSYSGRYERNNNRSEKNRKSKKISERKTDKP